MIRRSLELLLPTDHMRPHLNFATLPLITVLSLAGCSKPEHPPARSIAAADTKPACMQTLARGDTLQFSWGLTKVGDYEEGSLDTPWASSSLILDDPKLRLTEEEAREALNMAVERIDKTCRSQPVARMRLFLYPAGGVPGQSSAWIARLEKDKGTDITLHRTFLKDPRSDRFACLAEKEPGKSLNFGTRLPPVRQRELVGTWAESTFNLTMSIEKVGNKVYRVYRSAYCDSGSQGERLREAGDRYYVVGSSNGDYYQIQPSGELGVFDNDGPIEQKPAHFALHPLPTPRD